MIELGSESVIRHVMSNGYRKSADLNQYYVYIHCALLVSCFVVMILYIKSYNIL